LGKSFQIEKITIGRFGFSWAGRRFPVEKYSAAWAPCAFAVFAGHVSMAAPNLLYSIKLSLNFNASFFQILFCFALFQLVL